MNKRTIARRKAAARPAVDIERHARLCTVCSHLEREAIEEAFIHWEDAYMLDQEYRLTTRVAIYRHAHALGLFEKRSRNMRFALENIIERSHKAPVTADSVIRAVRACSCLKDNGEWVDPPTTHRVIVNVTRGDAHATIPVLSLPAGSLEGLPSGGSEALEHSAAPAEAQNLQPPQRLIDTKVRIENAATR